MMMGMESLLGKTFFILSGQLAITFAACWLLIRYFHYLHGQGADWIEATTNERGQVDLHPSYWKIKPYMWGNIITSVMLFMLMLINQSNLPVALALFSLWSITMGISIGLSLIRLDENLGTRVLGITVSITLITGLIGLYSGVDFQFMGKGLLIALIMLIAVNIIRLFVKVGGWLRRLISLAGVTIFTLYLVYDFNRLKTAENSWDSALNLAISIYLDIINLFLYLLDLLSK